MPTDLRRLSRFEQALVGVEQKLALLEALTPTNYRQELDRITASFKRAEVALPEFRYAPEPARRQRSEAASALLSSIELALSDGGVRSEFPEGLIELLLERVLELRIEASLVRACGTGAVRDLSRRRFVFDDEELSQAEQVALDWCKVSASGEDNGVLVPAIFVFEKKRRELGLQGSEISILERELASNCAVGGAHLYVRRGLRVAPNEAERLWVHEVLGHLLPRLLARREPPPFSVGTPGCTVDEEGRAVWLEERQGALHSERRVALARRFLLSLALRRGGDEVLREVLQDVLADATRRGEDVRYLAEAVCRIYRGGGIARELVYLPGYLRAQRAFAANPSDEEFFRRGRASFRALPVLRSVFPLRP